MNQPNNAIMPTVPISDVDVEGLHDVFSQFKAKRRKRKLYGHVPEVSSQTAVDDIGTMRTMWFLTQFSSAIDEIPPRGTYNHQVWLDEIWKKEPILAGAVYSMVAKMQSMTWIIKGTRNNARRAAFMVAEAAHLIGRDWTGFISPSAQDFYVQNNGVFWGLLREGGKYGQLSELYYVDTRCCRLTGNATYPMYYHSSLVSDEHWYEPQEFIHFTSMPSGNEQELELGASAVFRSARAAKLLMALHDYDAEKLANLPPEGIATVTGMTPKEFRDAIAMWKSQREQRNSLTFPQVLWLVGNNPGATISVDIKSFSTIPESFDRQTIVAQYINTLALCFGVDTREFWAISTGALGTGAESEIQHLKARGKGGGEFLALVERRLNTELPSGVTFEFDTSDIEEDKVAAEVAKAWIDAYIKLVYPPIPGGTVPGEQTTGQQESIIDADTFKRLLADKGVLPDWVVSGDRISISSHDVYKDDVADIVAFIWKMGRLTERPIIQLARRVVKAEGWSDALTGAKNSRQIIQGVIAGTPKDAKPVGPNITGKPIADAEVGRGTKITRKALKAEFQIWRDIPELQACVPDWALEED